MVGKRGRPRLRTAVFGLLVVVIACLALGVLGLGVEDRLQPTSLIVPGTSSARGQALAEEHFGPSSPFAVVLRGPAGAIERQGPPLVRALRRDPAVTVVSPWDRGAVGYLRPAPGKAIVLLDYHLPLDVAMRETVPALERTLEARIHPPVEAIQSGYASVTRNLQSESLKATERAELIAAPLLLIVLLLVFRSLVAAAIPLAFGALTVFAGRGVLVLLDSVMTIEALSVVVCTMMGLALGVDYSLFIVSRFREELESQRRSKYPGRFKDHAAASSPDVEATERDLQSSLARGSESGGDGAIDYWEAARVSRATAGRTTLFAGATLFVSILASSFLQPGSLLLSLATALVVVTPIAVAIALFALPALLALLGERINAGAIGRRDPSRERRPRIAAIAGATLRRPALAVALIAVPLVLLAVPALAFNTGAPGINELPSSSPARHDAEAIDSAVGPGWEAPFEIVVAARHGPITTPRRLALLARAQHRIAARPEVRSVIGPAPIQRQAQPLRRFGQQLTADGPDSSASQLSTLGPKLRNAAEAVRRLRAGLSEAAAGSGELGTGSERAGVGAGLIAGALDRAAQGGSRATDALEHLAAGSKRLTAGQQQAASAGLGLELELHALVPSLRNKALVRARRLAAELEAAAREDPSLKAMAKQERLLARVLSVEQQKVSKIRDVATELHGALGHLAEGGERLEGGAQQLAGSAAGLSGGLERLSSATHRLATGLGELHGGATALERGLAGGFQRSYPLQRGLGRAAVRVSAAAGPLTKGAAALHRRSPHLFDSGYFVLSALDGAPPVPRSLAGEAVNVGRGGQAARLLVVSTDPFNTAGSRATGTLLNAEAARLAREGYLVAGVSGGAAILNDYGSATRSALPIVIGAIVVITFMMLLVILRAPLLAALAVALNLASVAAAVGVVTLICKLPAGYPLGGHSYIDTVGAAGIFAVTFGLSIDYSVFLIARMRERRATGADNAEAIAFGLEKTAGVITGAAAIMIAVFVSFAAAPIATVSQLGVGLTVAILVDATVVRIVLLPALMLLLGDRVWHVPKRLDRLLPNLDFHAAPADNPGR
jgi:RND superfamily putative drug exporter